MRTFFPTALLVAAMITASSCSSSPPPDTRPLGNVTAKPQECGLISRQAIARATGLEEFDASGSRPGEPFERCVVVESPGDGFEAQLSIDLFNPSALSVEELASTKEHDKGIDLPAGLGPGFTAQIEGENGPSTYAYAWTDDARRRLSIWITPGAPGRDHRADAIEFVRQLKPILLSPPK